MERRVLLAIFLAFLVLYTWQALFVKPVPKPGAATAGATAGATSGATPAADAAAPAATGAGATESAAAAGSLAPAASAEGATPTPSPADAAAAPLVSETAERDVRVETAEVIAVFTNRGARLKSWRLKRYHNQANEPQELIENTLSSQPLPFTLRTGTGSVDTRLNTALYTVAGAPASSPAGSPVDLRFEYRDSAGLQALKEFHLDPASFVLTFRATVTNGEQAIIPSIVWGPAIADVGEVSRYTTKAEGILFQDGKVVRLDASKIAKQSAYEGDFKYAGVDDNYFITAALQAGASRVTFQPVAIPPAGPKGTARELVSYSVEPRTSAPQKFFVGPKDFDLLTAIDRDVAKAINFGYFEIIVVPLLRSLKWVNGYIGNYGWSIILLTFIINLILFPLRHKSVVSMRKMQEIQPEVKAIQDRYKNVKATDPAKQKMNQELMELYKVRGVNPASGCVPMLLTFPFIFAFYALLSTAIELRGAPWFGWIHDLSAHDPYFVVPILMGVSQVWQQRLAPAAGMDPVQQKMMLFMPVFFTFLFLWYPAGVALYWFVNNIWAIGQQYLTNYMIGPPKLAAAAGGGGSSAAARRMRRVGSGKTDAARENN
jgi:YidC/Oxa1 family membrane protein insertase